MLTYPRIRPGLWALYRGVTGIINNVAGDAAEWHEVGDDGLTVRQLVVPLAALDMPTRAHIPAVRLENIHPDWQPGQDVRYTDDYLRTHGTTARQGATRRLTDTEGLTGVSNLEFVEPEDFATFEPDARARVAHVRDPKTGDWHA